MHKIVIIFCWFFSLVSLTGCGAFTDKKVIEDMAFTSTTSYDLVSQESDGRQEEKLRITISFPVTNPNAKKNHQELSTIAKSSKEAKIRLSRQTSHTLVNGQLRTILFGEALAKRGIWKHIDTLVRDPSIGQRTKILVVEGSAHQMLNTNYPEFPYVGLYIDQMTEKEAEKHTVPEVDLYHWTRDMHDDGIDPVAPILKQGKKDIYLDGIALFDDDQYITKVESEKTLIFAFLLGNFKRGDISIDLNGDHPFDELVMLSSVQSNRDIQARRTKDDQHQFEVKMNLEVTGSVLEYIGDLDLGNPGDQVTLESRMASYIKEEAETMLDMMQKNHVDSIGIGKKIRNIVTYDEWSTMKWKQIYPDVKIDVDVRVKIKDIGKFQ